MNAIAIMTNGMVSQGGDITKILSVIEVDVEVVDLEVDIEIDEINVDIEVVDLEIDVEVCDE